MTFKPYPKHLPKVKEPKPLQRTSLKKRYQPTGELNLFKILWVERPHICEWCLIRLPKFNISLFDHIISVSKSKSLQLEKTNIRLLCRECHYTRHFGTKAQISQRIAIGESKNRGIIMEKA